MVYLVRIHRLHRRVRRIAQLGHARGPEVASDLPTRAVSCCYQLAMVSQSTLSFNGCQLRIPIVTSDATKGRGEPRSLS